MNRHHLFATAISFASALFVAACGGGSGGGDGGGTGDESKRLTIDVTDAPVDNAAEVVVEFGGIELFPSDGGGPIAFNFDQPVSENLLAFQGTDSFTLLSTNDVPAGDYNQIRLLINNDPSIRDSFVIFNDGSEVPIRVPSGDQTGLKLQGEFTVRESAGSSFTIEFDLREALTDPQGRDEIILRPALRLVENDAVGVIVGTVDSELMNADNCTSNPDTGSGNAVYLYLGENATVDDEGSHASDPLISALVSLDGSYEIGFVPEGDFTVAFTCQALDDDPQADDAITFSDPVNVTVTAGATSTADFIFVPPTGAIAGNVDPALTEDASCTSGNAVYLYAGASATADDQGSANPPSATAAVTENADSGELEYAFSEVETGEYTGAFTCQADDDAADTDDDIAFGATVDPISVTEDATTEANFPTPATGGSSAR